MMCSKIVVTGIYIVSKQWTNRSLYVAQSISERLDE